MLKAVGMAETSGQVRSGLHWEAESMGHSNLLIGLFEKWSQPSYRLGVTGDFHREAE